ncbi:4-oxalocrotonate tautomerase family protein [Nocardia sp. 2YAB30]|uniref:tautomerase family protein n=1 Tax=unclassified Nocardia TaxID=2637762 RepID=UPI003F96912F
MPYVNIKVTDEGVTREQKARLIRGVTYVVIDEVALTDWGVGGVNVEEWRKQHS